LIDIPGIIDIGWLRAVKVEDDQASVGLSPTARSGVRFQDIRRSTFPTTLRLKLNEPRLNSFIGPHGDDSFGMSATRRE
jgi:hypothetical protein